MDVRCMGMQGVTLKDVGVRGLLWSVTTGKNSDDATNPHLCECSHAKHYSMGCDKYDKEHNMSPPPPPPHLCECSHATHYNMGGDKYDKEHGVYKQNLDKWKAGGALEGLEAPVAEL